MSQSRFNAIFMLLMAIALVNAFILPPRTTNPIRKDFEGLFYPVSRPVNRLAGIIARRFEKTEVVDAGSPDTPRPAETILEENRHLRDALASLQVKYDQLAQLNADRASVGNVRDICQPYKIAGTDSSGLRESLVLEAIPNRAIKNDLPVIHANEFIGKVFRAGLTGAQVRLITDPGFALTGRIGQYHTDTYGLPTLTLVQNLQPLLQGIGHGTMAIRNGVSMEQVNSLGIHLNDVLVLDDRDYSPAVQGYNLGRITAIRPQANSPLVAEILIEPFTDAMKLREVMVVVK